MTQTIVTVVVDPAALAGGHPADHYAIRHRPSGRYLSWDDTLAPEIGLAMRFVTRAAVDRRIGCIEPEARDEFEAVGLRYQPAPTPTHGATT